MSYEDASSRLGDHMTTGVQAGLRAPGRLPTISCRRPLLGLQPSLRRFGRLADFPPASVARSVYVMSYLRLPVGVLAPGTQQLGVHRQYCTTRASPLDVSNDRSAHRVDFHHRG